MPRLTTQQYLKTHDRLRQLWLQNDYLFAQLSVPDQWMLHDFFLPAQDLPDLALLKHRTRITKLRPSLPQQAGRALARFWDSSAKVGMSRLARLKQPAGKVVRQEDRKLRASPLARPEVDAQKLARAFAGLARYRLMQGEARPAKNVSNREMLGGQPNSASETSR